MGFSLEYALGAATVGVSWSRYLLELLNKYGIHLHDLILFTLGNLKLSDGTIEGGMINFLLF
jgi:APA family basic amino acid/polyamine antiporter